ncbi:MAG: hypothetical protein KGZ69_11995 [Methylomonas sp.]|nr:hypothetical protein [Methylomonas sp.]
MTNLLAYHNDPKIKAAILAQLQAHYDADEIVKGQYWEDGKGCAVGCTIHSGDHMEYEGRFGIPVMLARLEDCIFEGLPNHKAKKWPLRFMNAIEPGAYLSRAGWKFLYWLLTDEKVNPGISHPSVSEAVKQCADVLNPLTEGRPVDRGAAKSAASAARNAARSAARNAESAAWSAARSAAWCAESAARSAESAAESAARNAAWSAASAARNAAYVRMADKLVELIVGAR